MIELIHRNRKRLTVLMGWGLALIVTVLAYAAWTAFTVIVGPRWASKVLARNWRRSPITAGLNRMICCSK